MRCLAFLSSLQGAKEQYGVPKEPELNYQTALPFSERSPALLT
jgi:hypothetical protein